MLKIYRSDGAGSLAQKGLRPAVEQSSSRGCAEPSRRAGAHALPRFRPDTGGRDAGRAAREGLARDAARLDDRSRPVTLAAVGLHELAQGLAAQPSLMEAAALPARASLVRGSSGAMHAAGPHRRCERPMKRLKSTGQAQRFVSAHDQINNLVPLRREHVPATDDRAVKRRAFTVWAEVSGVAAAASRRRHPTFRDLRPTG